jgi:protein-S-isoprenylcysteine O-methyltransferase Ste14
MPAGTWNWWRAWVFLGVVFIAAVVTTATLMRGNEALLVERFKPPVQQGQPLVDKIVVVLLLIAFTGVITFIPLDVFHVHVAAKPNTLVSSLGLLLFVAGWSLMTLSMLENTFAIAVVKYQETRHHTVVDSGVYGVVRHPMYASAVLLLVGMPLWLESYAAALLASLPIAILVVRIMIEERFLSRKLKGYDAYMERVRYRLIPFLW